LNPGSPTH